MTLRAAERESVDCCCRWAWPRRADAREVKRICDATTTLPGCTVSTMDDGATPMKAASAVANAAASKDATVPAIVGVK
eukprot:2252779-Prymnesium_polylepis.1